MQKIVITNAAILDVASGSFLNRHSVTVDEGVIESVRADVPPPESDALLIDAEGLTLMPGLCDAHVHVTAWTADISRLLRSPPYYTAARSKPILYDMLMRGFTTVRDVAGADYGLALAVDEGFLVGPRILYGGAGLSQTGGHGDMRSPGEQMPEWFGVHSLFTRLCDGVTDIRRACREEIRRGAHHIKLMLSGGVASPTDRIGNLQFSLEELGAAVEEAENAGLYVVAHTYTAEAVNRAIQGGVRSLEHCNLIDESSVDLFLEHDAFMVPTLVTYEALATEGIEAGLPAGVLDKVHEVLESGIHALKLAHDAGVNLAYGTDLLGDMHKHQLKEFEIRSRVQDPIDVVRAATIHAARLFREEGETAVINEGARADLLLVDGNPLEDLALFQEPDVNLKLIMKGGRIYKNALSSP